MKPSIPKGTRDFSSTEVANRTYIMNTIRTAFETYGFQPIETPSFENSSTLMGKYGEEGDRLIFKILNSGDYLKEFNYKVSEQFVHIIMYIINRHITKDYKTSEDLGELISKLDNQTVLFLNELNQNNQIETNLINTSFITIVLRVLEENIVKVSDIVKKYNEKVKYDSLEEVEKDFIFNRAIECFGYWSTFNHSKQASKYLSEKALRYDLTVPFARYVVQHQNEITFPFKRYQIQPVWRADRPQKGRFREFFQCDADVVGSKSLLQEVEFVQLYDAVFTNLKLIGTTIKINNRKILSGIAEVIGAKDKLIDFTVALDKLDKIGEEGVVKEMLEKGISETAIEKVKPLFQLSGSNSDQLDILQDLLQSSEEGVNGVNDLRFVINTINELGLQSASLELDVTLARGLNYYTGAIFEVAAPKEVKMGSIGGGGRYDDLTGIFGLKDVSGVGISFGLDRIYLVLEELELFNSVELPKPKVLFLNFNEENNLAQLKAVQALRKAGIKSEIYPDTASSNKQQKKQWKYVSNRGIEFVISDVENDQFTLKDMINGVQSDCTLEELIIKTT